MARHISQRELRNDSAAVLRLVESGHSLTVTRRGHPVADLDFAGLHPTVRVVALLS